MTTIIVDGKPLAVKMGSSFEFVLENRDFTDADGYSLSIDVPLRGCRQNEEIFGLRYRPDYGSRAAMFDCEIRTDLFSRYGVLTVVGYEAGDLKCQFLEGRSVQNFNRTFEDIYINDLSMPYPVYSLGISPTAHYGSIDDGAKWVALPWVYTEASELQNPVKFVSGILEWDGEILGLSYQPYLIWVVKWMCQEIGYSFDMTQWEESTDRHLLCCNALPVSWLNNSFAAALPHWTVAEFLVEIERLLCAEFEVDHKKKHIKFRYSKDVQERKTVTVLDNVIDEFSSEVSSEDESIGYRGDANISFDGDNTLFWKSAQCTWLIELMENTPGGIMEFENYTALLVWFETKKPLITGKESERGKDMGKMYHCLAEDTYYIAYVEYACLKTMPNAYWMILDQVNKMQPVISDNQNAEDIELRIIPVSSEFVDENGLKAMALSPQVGTDREDFDDDGIRQPFAMSMLNNGEVRKPEFYTKIYVGFWKGMSAFDNGSLPMPRVLPNYNNPESLALAPRYDTYTSEKLSTKEAVTFRFISDSIPEVRGIFIIRGKRYRCLKITANFSPEGMSQLLKGEFVPVVS